MIILGLDPGSRITGYGVVQKQGNRCTHVENGILLVADLPDHAKRLASLFESVQSLVQKYQVDHVAVENIFYHKNVKSVQKLGEVRGVLMASAAICGKTVAEYTALQVKQAVTGYGKADKQQVQVMICKLLGLKDVPDENASDALAIALCHAHQNPVLHLAMARAKDKNSLTQTNKNLLKKAAFYR